MHAPSSIHPHTVLRSSFGRAESEVAAICVTNFLASTDSPWDTEFSYESFTHWANDGLDLNELYQMMLRMRGGDHVIEGIHDLIKGEFLTRNDRDGATYFTVTDKFVKVMQRFA